MHHCLTNACRYHTAIRLYWKIQVHMVPTSSQKLESQVFVQKKWRAQFYEKQMDLYELAKFVNLIFPLCSELKTSVQTVYTCATVSSMRRNILLRYDYIEKTEFMYFHLLFKRWSTHFLKNICNKMSSQIYATFSYIQSIVLIPSLFTVPVALRIKLSSIIVGCILSVVSGYDNVVTVLYKLWASTISVIN